MAPTRSNKLSEIDCRKLAIYKKRSCCKKSLWSVLVGKKNLKKEHAVPIFIVCRYQNRIDNLGVKNENLLSKTTL